MNTISQRPNALVIRAAPPIESKRRFRQINIKVEGDKMRANRGGNLVSCRVAGKINIWL